MYTLPGRSRGSLAAEINVTPMVDVMLVLLIIFMVVTATLPFTARLPDARAAAPAPEDRVTLGIDVNGQYWIGRTPVSSAELALRVEQAYAHRAGDHVLYLKADHAAPYSLVLGAMDAARQVGVRRMAMITEQRK